jgi:predicted enzyme related to lactoylglutathione lyase
MKGIVNWFEIYTSDLERAKQFYTAVLGCRLEDVPVSSGRHSEMRYATFSTPDGAAGALVQLDVAGPGIGGTLVYFATEEITTELGCVEAAGGKVIRPKTSVGALGFIALIEDTEGNMIGLHSAR